MAGLVVKALNAAPHWLRTRVHSVVAGRGPVGRLYDRFAHPYDPQDVPSLPAPMTRSRRLFIGPANEAEQGYQWARAFERSLEDVAAVAMTGLDPSGFSVRADIKVPYSVYLRAPEWHVSLEAYLATCTHVLIESGLPLMGRRYRSDGFAEVEILRKRGLEVGAMFHGSDLRLPSQHKREHRRSPFTDAAVPSAILEDRTRHNITAVLDLGIPAFVSTPDLLRYLPSATWCPVVINPADWRTSRPASGWMHDPPVVLHAPSNPAIKGSTLIAPVLSKLHEEGVIEYRQVTGLKYEEMGQQYKEADIVLDQFLIGSYGVVACEALAAGCVVIGHVDDPTRSAVFDATGSAVPIVEATVDTLGGVLRGVVAATDEVSLHRDRGVQFVEQVHDGRRSAAAVRGFLTASPRA